MFANILFYFFNGFVVVLYTIYILFYTGLISNSPNFVNNIFKILFSLYLILKYNDFRYVKHTFSYVDRQIVVSVASSIIVFTFLDMIVKFLVKVRLNILKYTIPFFIKHKIPYNIDIKI